MAPSIFAAAMTKFHSRRRGNTMLGLFSSGSGASAKLNAIGKSLALIEFDATDTIFLKPKKKETEDYITGRFG